MRCRHVVLIGLLLSSCPLTKTGAQPLRVRAMAYPRLAQLAGIEGDILVVCKVDSNGKVTDVRVRSGHRGLISAVSANVRSWTFKPAAGEREYELLFRFRLRGDCRGDVCLEEFWFQYPDLVEVIGQRPPLNPGRLTIERD